MAHPYHHAVRSARLFGGAPEDYLAVHDWFDESKAITPFATEELKGLPDTYPFGL